MHRRLALALLTSALVLAPTYPVRAARSPTTTSTTTTTTEPPRPAPAYLANPKTPRERAAAYAYEWADKTNPAYALYSGGKITVPSDNPSQRGRAIDERTKVELDCTAFMSQALHVGGFTFVPGWRYDAKRHTATIAWVRARGPESLSALFVKLGRMRLLDPKGAQLGQPPPKGIQIGDIVAWDLNAKGTLALDHQLMVTEVAGDGSSWADIRVSYHTYDHRNRALDEYQAFVAPDAPKARLYAFHVEYPS